LTLNDTVAGVITVTATGSSSNLVWSALAAGANNIWNVTATGNQNWFDAGTTTPDYFFAGDNVLFDDSVAGVTNIISIGTGLAVAPASITNNSTANYIINGPGKISGGGSLVKQGSSSLTLNSVNDFFGPVTVQGGTLLLNSGALSSGGKNAVTVSSSATLSLGGTNVGNGTVVSIDSLAGNGTVDYLRTNSGVSAITFSVGNNNGSGVFSGSITNSEYIFGGLAQPTNTIALIKTGTGTETLSGTNTYAGQTTINGGGVLVAAAISDTAGASSISTNTVNLNSGTLEYSGAASVTTVRPIAGTTGTTNGIQVDNAGATLTVLGVVNNMTLKKLGAGTLSFGGANNNTALTMDVQAGSLILNKTNAGNQIAGIANVSNGATVQLAGNNNDQIFDSGNVASMNGTFDLNGRNESIQALSGGGTVRNSAGSTTSILTLGANNGSGNFLGTIANGAGTVALTKTGTGTATLTTNTYTGITTISGGTLALNAGGSLASSSISLAGGTKLDVSAVAGGLALTGSQTLTGSGVVTGSVSTASGTVITVAALGTAGTLSFSNNLALTSSVLNFDLSTNLVAGGGTNDLIQLAGGTLTLSGVTTVNVSGSLVAGNYTLIQGASSISGGPGNFALGTTLRQAVSFDTTTVPGSVLMVVGVGTPASLVWSGTNGSVWNVETTINWLNGGVADLFFNSDNVVFDDTSTNGTVNISGTVNPSSTYITNNALAYTIGGGVIGSGTVTKDGPGSLTLNGANTYGSVTMVKGGTLVLGNNSALGSAIGGTLVTNGGTLNLNAFSPSSEQVSIAGSGVGGSGALVNNGASASTIGTFTLTGDATVGGSANIATTDFTTVTNMLTKTGAGTLAVNWSSGAAFRSVGVLSVNQGSVSNAAAEFQVTGTNALGQALILNGGTALTGNKFTLNNTNGVTVKLAGTGTTGATIPAMQFNTAAAGTLETFDVDDIATAPFDLTINGPVSQLTGNASLTKTGLGTLLLGGTNTFAGTTRIANGVLSLGSPLALQNSTVDLNAADIGKLDFGAVTSATFGGLIGTRPLALTNASAAGVALTVGNNNVSSVSSNIISGSGSLTKVGTGTFQLAVTNTYTGKTFISAGTLQVATDNNLGAAPGAFVADQLTLNGGTLAITNSASFAATRGLTVGGGGINVGSGVNLIWGGPITGTGLTSSGLGTLILAGTNTYTTTAINNGGTLQVGNGGASGTLGSGTVTIAGGSILAFNRSDSIVVSNNVTGGQMVFNSGIVTFANTVDNNSAVATVNTNATLILNAPGGGHVVGGGNIALTLNGGTAILGPSGGDEIFNQKGIQMNSGTFDMAGTNETIGGLIGYGSITNSQANLNPNATLTLAINTVGTPGRDGSLDIMNGTLSINGCLITVAGNATVEAGAGLAGNGAINIPFGATLNNYGTMAPGNGNSVGTLVISNIPAISCNLLDQPGSTNYMKVSKTAGTNDQIVVIGSITCDGTLIVTNIAGSFVGGESYQLYVGGIGGTFANVILPSLPSGLSWDTSALYSTGTIAITGTLAANPRIGGVGVSGSNVTLSGTGGTPSGTYDVLSSTNLTLPLASWPSILTTNFDGSGNFSALLPYSSTVPQRFYILQVP
jgi:autotransporter-associated beta strand protein